MPNRSLQPIAKFEEKVLVAPGILVSPQEFEARFSGIDLDAARKKLTPGAFQAIMRFAGMIPGHPDTDVVEIGEIPE